VFLGQDLICFFFFVVVVVVVVPLSLSFLILDSVLLPQAQELN
jgi:hypothetical protein